MAIPDYQAIMLPLLRFAGDQDEHSIQEVIDKLSGQFKLTDSDLKATLPSGRQGVFENRVGWAKTYLKKAGLLESPRRGILKITSNGIGVLKQGVSEINIAFLNQFPEFVSFRAVRRGNEKEEIAPEPSLQNTPEELLEYGYQKLRQDLNQDLLEKVKNCSPAFFEKLVVELLVRMGYGGSIRDAGQAIGKSGDEGIDGIIKEDKLGLDVIYVQAKKWENSIGRPEIMKFAGALQGQHAKKGIFITTSFFTNDAIDYAKKVDSKIILIDGQNLCSLMTDNEVGVSKIVSYEIKRIDSDYFIEE